MQAARGIQIGQRGERERVVVGKVVVLPEIAVHVCRALGHDQCAGQVRDLKVLQQREERAYDAADDEKQREHRDDPAQMDLAAETARQNHQQRRPQEMKRGNERLSTIGNLPERELDTQHGNETDQRQRGSRHRCSAPV